MCTSAQLQKQQPWYHWRSSETWARQSVKITVLITSLQVQFETGPGEAEQRLLFEGGSKHEGTKREGALQCYESEKLGRKESTDGADFYGYVLQ